MNVDVSLLAQWAGAIAGIWAVVRLVVSPFQSAIRRNDETMKVLQKSIDLLTYELKDSQKDRENIHKVIDTHTNQIGALQDDTIRNSERLATLTNRKGV